MSVHEMARLRRDIKDSIVFTRTYLEMSLRQEDTGELRIWERRVGFLPATARRPQERRCIWPWRPKGLLHVDQLDDFLNLLTAQGWVLEYRRRRRRRVQSK